MRLADGNYPHQHQVRFPANQESLLTATVPNLTALPLFYNIPVNGNRQQKIGSLKRFLGVTLQQISFYKQSGDMKGGRDKVVSVILNNEVASYKYLGGDTRSSRLVLFVLLFLL